MFGSAWHDHLRPGQEWPLPAGPKEIALRALITGITGFAGSHLADHLLAHTDWSVAGVGLPADSDRNIAHISSQVSLHRIDLGDPDAVKAVLKVSRPDCVFHLAAQAAVGRSWQHPTETLVNNISAQANLLQSIVDLGLEPRVLVVGSADEYGLVEPRELPIDEDTPLRPLNPYAVSKVAQDYLGYQYFLSRGMAIVRVRPFNHIGSRQNPGFVVADFSRQIARIEAGQQEPVMRVGNLSAQRDFTDVRDMARGYHLALTKGMPGEVYNLGSGRARTIQEILDHLLSLSRVPVRVERDPDRMRPSDVPVLVCDSGRFRRQTGWEPEYDLEHSLLAALDDWRERVGTE